MSLHLEPKTAVLLETLAAGGAEIVATGNHGSTQDDVVAYLRDPGHDRVRPRATTPSTSTTRTWPSVLDATPTSCSTTAATSRPASSRAARAASILGGTEETTSGGDRLRGELAGRVPFPVIVINDSLLKAIGENKHAVGQSVVESFMRITNLMVPGRRFVVVGYGWCGRGVAHYLRALGGKVAVVEIDELKAFEAALDGFRVAAAARPRRRGARCSSRRPGTRTSSPRRSSTAVADGAVLANCGHFPWEIDVAALQGGATARDARSTTRSSASTCPTGGTSSCSPTDA